MTIINFIWNYAVTFIFVLSVLVFVHEFGHYWVARRCGVRIEAFSIGFGPELWGKQDRAGTRWKVCLFPLGGYVKMFGDADPASMTHDDNQEMSEEDRKVSFVHQSLPKRFAVVAAGPGANFLFAAIVLAGLFVFYGQPYTPPEVGTVAADSAAEAAGLKTGDTIVDINGQTIDRFEQIQQIVRMSPGRALTIAVMRNEQRVVVNATPKISQTADRFGNIQAIGLLGIGRHGMEYRRHDPFTAVWKAGVEIADIVAATLTAVGQMIAGTRAADELGGPLRIAQMSGEVAQNGFISVLWFMAMLSVNLGLINLFPIPLLDGGHLLFYSVEAVRGRPLSSRAQEYSFRVGLALVLSLMVFATWNDLSHLRIIAFFKNFIS
ncbi:putative zinc metalloprotease Atu1380 [Azospirillaceae bacterium]